MSASPRTASTRYDSVVIWWPRSCSRPRTASGSSASDRLRPRPRRRSNDGSTCSPRPFVPPALPAPPPGRPGRGVTPACSPHPYAYPPTRTSHRMRPLRTVNHALARLRHLRRSTPPSAPGAAPARRTAGRAGPGRRRPSAPRPAGESSRNPTASAISAGWPRRNQQPGLAGHHHVAHRVDRRRHHRDAAHHGLDHRRGQALVPAGQREHVEGGQQCPGTLTRCPVSRTRIEGICARPARPSGRPVPRRRPRPRSRRAGPAPAARPGSPPAPSGRSAARPCRSRSRHRAGRARPGRAGRPASPARRPSGAVHHHPDRPDPLRVRSAAGAPPRPPPRCPRTAPGR